MFCVKWNDEEHSGSRAVKEEAVSKKQSEKSDDSRNQCWRYNGHDDHRFFFVFPTLLCQQNPSHSSPTN